MLLRDRELVKWCKIFMKKVVGKFGGMGIKVVGKFGGMGILVVPLQPQTGNGGSRQPRRQKKSFGGHGKSCYLCRTRRRSGGGREEDL